MPTSKSQNATISIPQPNSITMEVCLISLTPFVCNRMSEKAKRELLLPSGRKNAAQKAASLKHNVFEEFRSSPYVLPDSEPTLLGVPAAAVKRSMANAALDVPGAAKAQIGRLVWAEVQYSEYVSIYGVPKVRCAVVRMADVSRTPDIRTSAILPRWAIKMNLNFIAPQLTDQAVVNLLATAGFTIGIGDGRPEKGKLSFGQFRVTAPDDPEFQAIVAEGGREAQVAAMAEAIPYDQESAEMLDFWTERVAELGRTPGLNGKVPAEEIAVA